MNYYNENDPKAAQWLRDLIWAGAISDGDVDTRSIEDILPNDLRGYKQCHFFAGIGGWSLALRLAGWPDDEPVWTGSCPCQPFSAAGKSGGFADERHLWPAFFHLLDERKPPVVFGEQVASPDGLAWLDLVQTDLENALYAVGAADLCAAGVGAPHIRQRLYWVANAAGQRRKGRIAAGNAEQPRSSGLLPTGPSADALWLADTDGGDASAQRKQRGGQHGRQPENGGTTGDVGNANHARLQGWGQRRNGAGKWPTWEASLVDCRNGERRPVEPGTFPLAHGVPGRMGLLRGYGNAIVPQVAAEFIGAYLDTV